MKPVLRATLAIAVLLACTGGRVKNRTERYPGLRHQMVRDQIEARGIRNERVLQALRTVPRHEFVPENIRHEAYNDYPLPIGLGQTISQPFIVAQMTELAEPGPNDRVLEIGTGSGYQAAILAALVKDVYTIEITDDLARDAGERLERLGYRNIHVRSGDGYIGWTDAAPFDAILVTAAAPSVPDSLVSQLRDGGRLVIPLGEENETQTLALFCKHGDRLTRSDVEAVRFVPMRGEIERKARK